MCQPPGGTKSNERVFRSSTRPTLSLLALVIQKKVNSGRNFWIDLDCTRKSKQKTTSRIESQSLSCVRPMIEIKKLFGGSLRKISKSFAIKSSRLAKTSGL